MTKLEEIDTNRIFMNLLRESEAYCVQNKLTTNDSLSSMTCDAYDDETEKCRPEKLDELINAMKGAAYYERKYIEEVDDHEHFVYAYEPNPSYKGTHAFVVSVFEKNRDMMTNYVDASDLQYAFDYETSKALKNFKIFS